jgi:hypothetical protein
VRGLTDGAPGDGDVDDQGNHHRRYIRLRRICQCKDVRSNSFLQNRYIKWLGCRVGVIQRSRSRAARRMSAGVSRPPASRAYGTRSESLKIPSQSVQRRGNAQPNRQCNCRCPRSQSNAFAILQFPGHADDFGAMLGRRVIC